MTSRFEGPPTPETRAHALEHLLVSLIRKYGDNGSSVLITPETTEGGYTLSISRIGDAFLLEVLDEVPAADEPWPAP